VVFAGAPSTTNARHATRTLLVSIHDVAPIHLDRVMKAERLLASLGVPAVTYLLVPNFHRDGPPVHEQAAFVSWCRTSRPFDVQWFLHGYYHREDPRRDARAEGGDAGGTALREVKSWLARRVMTAGEGEFLALRGAALAARLRAGIDSFTACLGAAPSGFVAPAWLFNEELPPALARAGIVFTEDHFRLVDVRAGREVRAGVITWATRTVPRKYGSLVAAAVLPRAWRARPVLRLAVHPFDFDHPATVSSIARTLDALRRDRDIVTITPRLFD
jgi:predicted deacetylase